MPARASPSAFPAIAVAVLLLAVALAAWPPAVASDVDDPDMEDGSGDAVSGKPARDLISGWIVNETEGTIELALKMTELDPYTPYSDISSLPVVNYEFFFDITVDGVTTNYAARAVVPIHGPAVATASYTLQAVTYNSQGQVTGTTEAASAGGSYDFQLAEIGFVVEKANIGNPGRDDTLTGMWGRITSGSQRNQEDPVTEDTMLSHLSPGRSFVFSGGITYYLVTLTADEVATNATSDLPATFEIQIHNDAESDLAADVALKNSSALPNNWTMRTDYQKYTLEPGATATALVTITPDVNATATTRKIKIIGEWTDDEGERRISANSIELSITIPKTDDGGPGPGGDDNPTGDSGLVGLVVPVAALGGVAAVGGIAYFVVLPRRRKAKARERFQKLSQAQWAKSPRSGPPRPVAGAPAGQAPGQPRPAIPRPPSPPSRR